MTLNDLYVADVPLRNCSVTYSHWDNFPNLWARWQQRV